MQISIHAREKLIYIRPLVKNMNSTNNILECHRKKLRSCSQKGIAHLLQDEYVYLRSLCFIIYNGFGNQKLLTYLCSLPRHSDFLHMHLSGLTLTSNALEKADLQQKVFLRNQSIRVFFSDK